MKLSKKVLIVSTAVITVLCLLTGGGIWYLSRDTPDATVDATKKVEEKKEPKKALFYKELPEMTLNVNDVEKMISFVVVVGVEDEKSIKQVETYMPRIQSAIILLVKSQKYAYLSDYHNQVDFLSKINSKINEITDEPIVVETLFSKILIN